jgi:hypothetical protein
VFQSRRFCDSYRLGDGDTGERDDTADDVPDAPPPLPSECGLSGCGIKSIDLAANNKSNDATGGSVNNKRSCKSKE